jgi:ATP-dependent Clp protease ATP-binding subunit ClpX
MGRQSIGFISEDHPDQTPAEHGHTLAQVQPDDLIHYGMIPEMIGRLPCITALEPLDCDAMIRILTEPKNALVRQYNRLFQLENTELSFTDEALAEIAKKAQARDVGARALRSVVEDLMLHLMYELPEQKEENAQYEITSKMINGEVEPNLFTARKPGKKESA